ncbi:PQQ-binding-like beta-propeller repeat protein [Nocardiopsis sp. HNM0947]|uniref:PQQ-binding-like beta-propeller repeat protein n=1 Tax=Nocardiopsis coralli TaxID=2772213 RepID=A0ABR9PBL2_9ACTN|nr:PQQ-binding-like beta-propeller repeat protein [Nocardiopsis coralli]MBE3001227.1 PQQ-binding-like beta-propeller repeat protein [Nocardiopsis coralli]
MRAAISWVGLGLIAGALAWSPLAVVLASGAPAEGMTEWVGLGTFFSWLLGLYVLTGVVRWRTGETAPATEPRGTGCLVPALLMAAVGIGLAALVHFGWDGEPAVAGPIQANAWLLAISVAAGLLLLTAATERPSPQPLARTFPAFAAGSLAVVLTGGLVNIVHFPQPRHEVADEPTELGEPDPMPERVEEVGWEWEPELGSSVLRVEEGSHGPLVVLTDGVVSLDGTDGSEIWSYRRPYAPHFEVWVDDDHVIVSRAPVVGTEDALVDVLALDTGAPEPGLQGVAQPNEDDADARDELSSDPDEDVVTRTAEHVIRTESGIGADADTQLVSEEIGTGAERWSVPLDDERCGPGTAQWLHGLLVSTHDCRDEEETESAEEAEDDGPGGSDDRGEYEEPAEREYLVRALDPETGEQVWERSWTRSEDDRFHVSSGGPAGAGADPVLLVHFEGWTEEGLVLDPATGEDVFTLPEELRADGTWFDRFLGADSESATYLVDRRGRDAEVEHVDPQGNVLEAVENFPRSVNGDSIEVLDEMLLHQVRSQGRPTVTTTEFGQQAEHRTYERIRLEEPEGDVGWSALVPVPGAVAAVAEADEPEVGDPDKIRTEGAVRGLTP